MAKSYIEVLNDAIDSIQLKANTILTLDEDPSISEEDKKIMFEKTNGKIDAILEKLEKAKSKH